MNMNKRVLSLAVLFCVYFQFKEEQAKINCLRSLIKNQIQK